MGRRPSMVRRLHEGAALRWAAVGGLLVIGAVHLNLYAGESYDRIPTIGWLFLLTVVSAWALAAVMAVRPHLLTALLSAGFALSVLGGYVLTLLLPAGLFSFKEPGISYSGGLSIVAEGCVAITSSLLIRGGDRARRQGGAGRHRGPF